MRRAGSTRALLALVVVLPLFIPAVRAAELSDETILRNFELVAFRNEMYRLPDPRLHKWVGAVRIFVRRDAPADAAAERILDGQLERLAAITRLHFAKVDDEARANFLIVFTTRDRYAATTLEALGDMPTTHRDAVARRLPATNCVGLYQVDERAGALLKATVVIPLDHARATGRLRRCVVEETTQSMGLPNDDNEVYPSVFNDTSRLDDLTGHDVMLLRLLYDPRMKAGMTREQALEVARAILPELRR